MLGVFFPFFARAGSVVYDYFSVLVFSLSCSVVFVFNKSTRHNVDLLLQS